MDFKYLGKKIKGPRPALFTNGIKFITHPHLTHLLDTTAFTYKGTRIVLYLTWDINVLLFYALDPSTAEHAARSIVEYVESKLGGERIEYAFHQYEMDQPDSLFSNGPE